MIPLFYRFKGGKGVATALGAGLALAPLTTLIMAGIWLVTMWRWRISALASLVAIVSGPVVSALLEPDTLPLFGLLTLLIVVRHRSEERRVGKECRSRWVLDQ